MVERQRSPVRGDYPEHSDQSVSFQMHLRSRLGNPPRFQCPLRLVVDTHPPIRFQSRQPSPATVPDQPQVVHARVPTIEENALGRETPLPRGQQHGEEMLVLRDAIMRFVVDAVINRDDAVAIGPDESNEVDAVDDGVMLARPVPGDQVHLPGVGFVERRVVTDEDAFRSINERGDFLPQSGGIGFEAVQEAGEGIVGGRIGAARLETSRLDATDGAGRGDEEVDVLSVGTARRIHACYSTRSRPLRSTA